mmetsp:Transcript_20102/g.43745  ORF Transcript_20102/g.43745 Transcript_20102/m.43745 type:complete len:215 (-) Transcript_20102:884-1528(-)
MEPNRFRHLTFSTPQLNFNTNNKQNTHTMRSSTIATVLVGLCAIESGRAWSAPKQANTGAVSRKSMLQTLVVQGVGAVSAAALLQTNTQPAFAVATGDKLPSGVVVEVVKDGKGIKPEVGELIAIRFAAYVGERKIDDIFDTSEPYYTRLGSGGLLKGVESTLPLMKLGDRWKLTIPVSKQTYARTNEHTHTEMFELTLIVEHRTRIIEYWMWH